MNKMIRIGTRKSALAMVQTELVAEALKRVQPGLLVETVTKVTEGDRILNKPLLEFGGKGVFVTEFEQALLKGEIDFAVHSAKDLPMDLEDGLGIVAVPVIPALRETKALVDTVIGMNLNATMFCLVVAVILLIFGTFMEGTAIAVLLVPVLWPIAQSMGINVVHFGMIVCISNVVGTMTPPVAVNIYSAATVSKLKMGEIAKAEIPFLVGYVGVFFLCVFSEWFCTFLT